MNDKIKSMAYERSVEKTPGGPFVPSKVQLAKKVSMLTPLPPNRNKKCIFDTLYSS